MQALPTGQYLYGKLNVEVETLNCPSSISKGVVSERLFLMEISSGKSCCLEGTVVVRRGCTVFVKYCI